MDFEQQQKAFEFQSFEAIRPLFPSDAQASRCVPFFLGSATNPPIKI